MTTAHRARSITLVLALSACSPAEPSYVFEDTDGGTTARADTGAARDTGSTARTDAGTVPTGDSGTSGNCTSGGMVPGMWARTTSGTDADFVGAFGGQPSGLIAIADTAIRRWNGSAWGMGPALEFSRQSGMNIMTLRLTAVGGFDDATTFAAGIVGTNGGGEAPRGEMYRLSGSAATAVPLPGMNIQIVAIRGTAANNVWAVGGHTALQWDGARFVDRSAGIPMNAELYDVWAFAPDNVWAVGTKVMRWDGSAWRDAGTTPAGAYFGVWGSSPNDVYVVGNTVTRHWNGTAFSDVLTGTTADLRAVWGSSARDVWAAGEGGAMVHFDGNAWGPVSSGVTARISRLWGFAGNDVWAVGERGLALHYTFTGDPMMTTVPCVMGNPNGLGDGMGTRVSAVNQSVCARRASGEVRCWGNNNGGQLGDGTLMTHLEPVVIPALTGVADIAISAFHGCAAKADGTVWCWGSGRNGQLGNGMDLITSPTPVRAGTLDDAAGVVVGASHSCALQRGGGVLCWGANTSGQVGDGTTNQRAFPVPVAGYMDITQVAAGLNHTCARRANGAVICWGAGTLGQLGNGAMGNSSQAVAVQGLSDALFLGAGANHTCAVRASGAVVCWGANGTGQLGDGSTMNRAAPVPVMGVTDASAVGAGLSHSCAVRRGGGVRCWGANARGQLGDGATADRPAAVDVQGVTDAARVTGGGDFTCVTRASGAIACFGGNSNGQLGRGTMSVSERVPAAPMGL